MVAGAADVDAVALARGIGLDLVGAAALGEVAGDVSVPIELPGASMPPLATRPLMVPLPPSMPPLSG